MTAREWMLSTLPFGYEGGLVRPRAKCADGFTVSVQAGKCLHCHPMEDGLEEYDRVELGYPSEADELILPYAEHEDAPTQTVYHYVPMDVVDALFEKHGGCVEADYSNIQGGKL